MCNMVFVAFVFLQSSGDKALYIWRPVPPSSVFVALGMIATTTEAPPPQDSVRCVPRRWVVESTFKPIKVRVSVCQILYSNRFSTCVGGHWLRLRRIMCFEAH